MSLTLAQQRALAVIPKISGFTSLVFSAVIVGFIFKENRDSSKVEGTKNAHRQRKSATSKTYNRLLLGISLVDMSSSFWFALSTWPIPSDTDILWAVGNSATCTAQAFFKQLAITSPLYNLSLTVYYVLVVRYGWREDQIRAKIEPYLHILPLLWGIATAVCGVVLSLFDDTTLWCCVAPGGNPHSTIFAWVFFLGPLWFAIIFVTVNLCLVVNHVQKVTLSADNYSGLSCEAPPSQHPMEDDNDDDNDDVDDDIVDTYEQTLHRDNSLDVGKKQYDDEDSRGYATESSTNNSDTTSFTASRTFHGVKRNSDTVLMLAAARMTQKQCIGKAIRRTSSFNVTSFRQSLTAQSLENGFSSLARTALPRRRSSTSSVSITQFAVRRDRVKNQCMRYIIAFYFTWVPITIVRIIQIANGTPSVALLILAGFATPLQGLPNFLVYLYPRFVVIGTLERLRRRAKRKSDPAISRRPFEHHDQTQKAWNNRLQLGKLSVIESNEMK